ncbi:MAG: prepilin-type N-terminal cleavage/methylation domain-containing protein [bacterium]|nr:prepilin-type N-terminal cleavage/methylation domain-containing protein [bacterium]
MVNTGSKTVRGFTLIELLVVLAIIMIISVVVITSQSSFNKTLILANTAYDIALTVRSAQSFGISSRNIIGAMNTGYGVHFQRGDSFIFFADTNPPALLNCHGLPSSGDEDAPDAKPGNCAYDEDAGEFVNTYTLGNGMTISNFCVDDSCDADVTSLDIVFVRPNPDAFISVGGSFFTDYAKTCIIVTSPQGGEKYISVSKSGHINANAASCP